MELDKNVTGMFSWRGTSAPKHIRNEITSLFVSLAQFSNRNSVQGTNSDRAVGTEHVRAAAGTFCAAWNSGVQISNTERS